MSFEFFIATRYLTSKRRQAFISLVSVMSVLGVALGVGALVVVMGVYNGFSSDIRDKILGANSHILLQPFLPEIFTLDENGEGGYKDIIKDLQNLKGVKAVAPFIYTEVLLSTPRGATGLVIRGIEPQNAHEALPMLQNLEEGSVEDLIQSRGAQGILIGKELAMRFGLALDDRVHLLSPAGEQSITGFTPKIKTYKVAGIFKAGLNDYDNRLAFVSLASVRDLIGLKDDRISGLELYLDNPFDAQIIANSIVQKYDLLNARHWIEMNSGLFAALQLERIGMFIVLTMIVLIGSFSIVTSLVMLVMEKRKDIAILISMGATTSSIRKIFMLQGTIIGAFGTLLGYAGGLTVAYVLKTYKIIELPQGVYSTQYLPILVSIYDVAFIGIASFVLCFLATIYPARQAAKLAPTDALRYE